MKDEKLINIILYGDIYETPLSILGEHYDSNRVYDEEQKIRLSIAATIKNMDLSKS